MHPSRSLDQVLDRLSSISTSSNLATVMSSILYLKLTSTSNWINYDGILGNVKHNFLRYAIVIYCSQFGKNYQHLPFKALSFKLLLGRNRGPQNADFKVVYKPVICVPVPFKFVESCVRAHSAKGGTGRYKDGTGAVQCGTRAVQCGTRAVQCGTRAV